MSQIIAMNRFKIVPGMESEFEGIWKSRNTYLEDVPGFIRFNLVKGPAREDHVLYASHTPSGRPSRISRHGQNQKLSGKHTKVQEVEVIYTLGTPTSKVLQ
jgi:hypothetical protein